MRFRRATETPFNLVFESRPKQTPLSPRILKKKGTRFLRLLLTSLES